jgi:hypothetical protein
VRHVREELGFHAAGAFKLEILLLQGLLEVLDFGHVTRRRKHALQHPITIVEGAGIARYARFDTIPVTRAQLVIVDLTFGEDAMNAGVGEHWIREVVLER